MNRRAFLRTPLALVSVPSVLVLPVPVVRPGLAFGAAGAAIGFSGASLGWVIGSYIGGSLFVDCSDGYEKTDPR